MFQYFSATVGRFLIVSISCVYNYRFANITCVYITIYGTGSTITIIGFAIWPDLPRTQSLNHAIKTLPMVFAMYTLYNHLL